MNKFITDIQEAMKAKRATEQWLSMETGIPQPTIHRLVTGQNKKLDLSKIQIIQNALGINSTEKQPQTIAEITSSYSLEAKTVADTIEMIIEGKTEEERREMVKKIMADIWKKYS